MKEIIEIIKTKNELEIKEILDEMHDYDLALLILELDDDFRNKVLKLFSDEKLADIFSYLDEEDAVNILQEFNDNKKAAILNEMEPDDAIDIINVVDNEDNVNSVIKLLDKDVREDILELERYDEYTAGSIMTTHFISVLGGCEIKVAMKNLVANAPNVESINTIFVVDDNNYLLGTIHLKNLIIAKSPCNVDDIMDTNFKYVNTDTNSEEASKIVNDYDIFDLPVLDHGIIKGIITMDDAIDSMIDEANEDYAKLSGLTTDEAEDEKIFVSIRKRIPWLAILLICDLFVPIISTLFDYLFKVDSLTVFLIFEPVVLGLAGNCAMQSLGITIRCISNNALEKKKQVLNHTLKELVAGIVIGFILSVITFGITVGMLKLNESTSLDVFEVAFTIALSIFVGLSISSVVGSLVPIFFYKIKLDPAVASGPFITTIIDIITIVIYFVITTLMFAYLL